MNKLTTIKILALVLFIVAPFLSFCGGGGGGGGNDGGGGDATTSIFSDDNLDGVDNMT